MRKYGFLLTRILTKKDRICDSVHIRGSKVSEKLNSRIVHAVSEAAG